MAPGADVEQRRVRGLEPPDVGVRAVDADRGLVPADDRRPGNVLADGLDGVDGPAGELDPERGRNRLTASLDGEYIGREWLEYLSLKGLGFVIRSRDVSV